MSDFDRAKLSAFLDGELEPARAREVEALVAADPLAGGESLRNRMSRDLNNFGAPRLAMRSALTQPEARPKACRIVRGLS